MRAADKFSQLTNAGNQARAKIEAAASKTRHQLADAVAEK